MSLERVAIRTVDVPPDDKVHHLVDRCDTLIISVFIFHFYKLVSSVEGSAAKRREGAFLILRENNIEPIEDGRVWRIYVDSADIVTLSGPFDRVVVLTIQFLKWLPQNGFRSTGLEGTSRNDRMRSVSLA